METDAPSRTFLTDLSINLVETIYGKQEESEHLLELLQLEFPDEEYTIDDIMEWNSLQAEIEDIAIQLETQGLCYEKLLSIQSPILDPL